jgi:hypothetical protein
MKTISAIFSILLVFLFLGPLAAFIVTAGEAAQQAGGTGAQINNTQAMTQFIMYSTITAYQCAGDGAFEKGLFGDIGGTFWGSWAQVRDDAIQATHNGFEELNESYPRKTELNCYGAEDDLPLMQDIYDDFNPVDSESWVNDQEGKFSKRSFEITEKTVSAVEQGVDLGPCLAYEEGENNNGLSVDFSYFITDETEPNVIRFPHTNDFSPGNLYGNGFQEGNGETLKSTTTGNKLDIGKCMQPTEPGEYPVNKVPNKNTNNLVGAPNNHAPNDGPLVTLTVIGADDNALYGSGYVLTEGKATVKGFGGCSSENNCKGPGTGGDGLKLRQWRLCPGTKGYIQTNTGKNAWEKEAAGGNWEDNPSYSKDNTPGKPDIEAAGDRKANQIHPYIVITEHKTGCNS